MFSTMIVDDYDYYRKTVSSMPVWGETSGFIITQEAANGREALQKLRQQPVNLLLTDIRMPLIDGLALIKKATEEAVCDCIVIMSQFSDFEYAREGLSSGAIDYLLKPVDPEALSKVLARAAAHINDKRLQDARRQYIESLLDKSTEEFFPDAELDTVVQLLAQGSWDAPVAAARLADSAFSAVNYDSAKTARILNKSLRRLAVSIETDYPWLDKFYNLQDLILGDYDITADIATLKGAFVSKIDTVLAIIRKFELGIDSSHMVRKACKTILMNIDSGISLSELSDKLFISRTYLSQVFSEKTGVLLITYFTEVKMERAKVLIAAGCKSFEIAEILGYENEEYFKKVFKKTTGMSISEYRGAKR